MQGALQGIKVIEVSQVLAAPFCGYQFSLLGAEVIKVEMPEAPDCARNRGPIAELNKNGTVLRKLFLEKNPLLRPDLPHT